MSTGEKVQFYMYFGVQIPSPAFRNIPLEMNVLSANQIKSKRGKKMGDSLVPHEIGRAHV